MVSFDVTNLYSYIPNELGKQAISFWIEKYPKALHTRLKKRCTVDDIEKYPK